MIGFQNLMIERKMKTKELAELIGSTPGIISGWFHKGVPKKRLKSLANIFNVDEEYLNTKINDIKYIYTKRKRI